MSQVTSSKTVSNMLTVTNRTPASIKRRHQARCPSARAAMLIAHLLRFQQGKRAFADDISLYASRKLSSSCFAAVRLERGRGHPRPREVSAAVFSGGR